MKPLEQQIINNLMTLDESEYCLDRTNKIALMKLAEEESFGTLSPEFINHYALNTFIASIFGNEYLMLWLRIEDYLSNKNDMILAQEKLVQVEEALKKCLEEVTPQAKARGVAMLPIEVANAQFMRKLYSLNDDNLSDIFLKYLPAPRAKIFKGQEIPELISKREQDSMREIMNVLQRSKHDLASLEKDIVKVQRQFRAKKREKENLERLPYRYRHIWQGPGESIITENTKNRAKELLADANKPYHPKCEEMLAKRIMEAAKKIELFSTVSHLTAASALESIFNDGLYGRQTMIQSYMVFKKASLEACDIKEGDANVVCLGANGIDPTSRHGIELQFDAKKIAENNPCIFFKQRDLGFDPKKIRHVKIGELDLYFSHTSNTRLQQDEYSSFVLYKGVSGGWPHGESYVTKAKLIADNINEMHQILTLNFFRFIDGLTILNVAENIYDKEAIYFALSKLSHEELVETLLQIGKNMTDTMEFNFYGAYKIDFSALLTINNDNPLFTLDLPSFVDELKAGHLETLIEAKEKLPEIFNSYRFIDHLLSTTENETAITALQEQRAQCTLPPWMQEASEGFNSTR